MPTEKQIAAQLKREQTVLKRGIIAEVTEAALHLIHESHLNGTDLWPEDGFRTHSMATFNYNDIGDVQIFVKYDIDSRPEQFMKVNLINKDYQRVSLQRDQIELILDQATHNNIFFNYIRSSEIGVGLRNTWMTLRFDFTINNI